MNIEDQTPSEILFEHVLETASDTPVTKRILLYKSAAESLTSLQPRKRAALRDLANSLQQVEDATLELKLKFKKEKLSA